MGIPAGNETPDEAALAAQFKARKPAQEISYAHLRTLQPLSPTAPKAQDQPQTSSLPLPPPASDNQPPAATGPQAHDPAILSLANNNDLNVATLAREAYKAKNNGESPEDEVVISLH